MNCIQKANTEFLKDLKDIIPSQNFMRGVFKILATLVVTVLAIILFIWVTTSVINIKSTPLFWWLSVFFGLGGSLVLGVFYIMHLLEVCIPSVYPPSTTGETE